MSAPSRLFSSIFMLQCALVILLCSGVLGCQKELGDIEKSSLAIVHGRPAIAFIVPLAIRYIRADDHSGANWGDLITQSHELIGPPYSGTLHRLVMKMIDDRPAVCFFREYDNSLSVAYTRAVDATGSSWSGGWKSVHISNVDQHQIAMIELEVEALPLIACTSSSDRLLFRRALDPDGDNWSPGHETDFTINVIWATAFTHTISLAMVDSKPACAYVDLSGENVFVLHALDAYGDTWETTAVLLSTRSRVTNPILMGLANGGYVVLFYEKRPEVESFQLENVYALYRPKGCTTLQCVDEEKLSTMTNDGYRHATALSGALVPGTNSIIFQFTWYNSGSYELYVGGVDYVEDPLPNTLLLSRIYFTSGPTQDCTFILNDVEFSFLVVNSDRFYAKQCHWDFGGSVAEGNGQYMGVWRNEAATQTGLSAQQLVFHASVDLAFPSNCLVQPSMAPIGSPTTAPSSAPTTAQPYTPAAPSMAPTLGPTSQPSVLSSIGTETTFSGSNDSETNTVAAETSVSGADTSMPAVVATTTTVASDSSTTTIAIIVGIIGCLVLVLNAAGLVWCMARRRSGRDGAPSDAHRSRRSNSRGSHPSRSSHRASLTSRRSHYHQVSSTVGMTDLRSIASPMSLARVSSHSRGSTRQTPVRSDYGNLPLSTVHDMSSTGVSALGTDYSYMPVPKNRYANAHYVGIETLQVPAVYSNLTMAQTYGELALKSEKELQDE